VAPRTRKPTPSAFPPNPEWYRDGVIYECHVRAFADSNADGIGDFGGLTERIGYLEELGVTAIWLLPFYPSPGRDDGYDTADFFAVNSSYGDMASFRKFLRAAHQSGIRVITELVLNHTSDQHPWFQRARRAPSGSKWRDFYVWSDDPSRYSEARVIFSDSEPSNWTWDPEAGAYYWHRFFHHQPDLNFDNPEVGTALLKVVDHWFDLGVDGLRLDAVPYLYEREGTNCENLPETHAFLRRLRAHVDANYQDRMLLAEANQWPADASAYFGDGDECHMNFHFPVMPRLFMAVQNEQRFPIVDILEQTPELPDGCQWATFLRNHDELTLEMVTEEERDSMYRAYARDPQMRLNLGIRRRLAPLLDGDRRKIELLNALLFSLPGTPVIYYGDELGMGDNVYLGDRDGVRTPMQWTPDRNGGFSTANPQRLFLPLVTDNRYHYEAINVSDQLSDRTSLLWSMIQLITLRKRHRVLGRGSIEFLDPDNPHVLAFIRSPVDGSDEPPFLVVANLSRLAQSVELDLSRFSGSSVQEVFGQSTFGKIGDSSWHITMAPYGYFWFVLQPPVDPDELTDERDVPHLSGSWPSLIRRPSADTLAAIERLVTRARWYRGSARRVRSVQVTSVVPCGERTMLLVVEVVHDNGESDSYMVPVSAVASAEGIDERAIIAHLDDGVLVDTLSSVAGAMDLVDTMAAKGRLRMQRPRLAVSATAAFRRELGADPAVTITSKEQTNSGATVGGIVLKVLRHVDEGESPEVELGRLLSASHFTHQAELLGWATLERDSDGSRAPIQSTAIVATKLVPHDEDAWTQALDEVGRFLERVPVASEPPPVNDRFLPLLPEDAAPIEEDDARNLLGSFAVGAYDLGSRTAELHQILAEAPGELGAEPFGELTRKALAQELRTQVRHALRELRRFQRGASDELRDRISVVLGAEGELLRRLSQLRDEPLDGLRIRIHGDLHLGQILVAGSDHVFIDFEGEPLRPISERRIKRSPLLDIAGMLRSYDYAGQMGARVQAERGFDGAHLMGWSEWWARETGRHFLAGYLTTLDGGSLLPGQLESRRLLLDCCMLGKAAYELRYEIEHRPDWISVPLRALERATGGGTGI